MTSVLNSEAYKDLPKNISFKEMIIDIINNNLEYILSFENIIAIKLLEKNKLEIKILEMQKLFRERDDELEMLGEKVIDYYSNTESNYYSDVIKIHFNENLITNIDEIEIISNYIEKIENFSENSSQENSYLDIDDKLFILMNKNINKIREIIDVDFISISINNIDITNKLRSFSLDFFVEMQKNMIDNINKSTDNNKIMDLYYKFNLKNIIFLDTINSYIYSINKEISELKMKLEDIIDYINIIDDKLNLIEVEVNNLYLIDKDFL